MSRLMVVGILWLGTISSPSANAAEVGWVDTILPPASRSHDFGTVVRGSKIRHVFVLANTTSSQVRILEWRTKCGCTDVKAGAKVIPPGTQTTLEATIDTTRFTGPKKSGLTLVFSEPSFVQIDLNLDCFIRGDITMNPGLFDFGVVRRGKETPTAKLVLTYAGGRPDWEITQMKTRTAQVKVTSTEQSRTPDGQINFLLTAELQPDIPNGSFKDEVKLFNNEQKEAPLPISVVANIQSAVSMAPSIINFGPVKPGKSVTKIVMVRGSEPFSIKKVSPSKPELEVASPGDQTKPIHNLTLKFTAPTQAGPYHATMDVVTNLDNEPPAQLKTFATVVP
ncbi:MAG: DUF1573 domain-containing protein [Planctomycetes bacterium SCN 63-9]|nr:MAG: DUF1573 domain-containing protein [Planctomycetes bacterium SCN 63-9]